MTETTKNTQEALRKIATDQAFCHYFCNAGEEDFPETEEEVIEMLNNGETEKNGKELVIWAPYENAGLKDLSTDITDTIETNLYYLKQAYKEGTKNSYVYILALTSNMDDDYDGKNFAFHRKEDAEAKLKEYYQEVIDIYKQDINKKEETKSKKEMEESLAETNEELYQPAFEVWNCFGFIKGTITRTEVQ